MGSDQLQCILSELLAHQNASAIFPKINKIVKYKVKTMNINVKYKSRRHARL